ncbi:molybdate ABC transporter substrate-binding protein [Oryzibacter oryziterrae]|uniref:molybdate ABC transporter substrate-binding protein n=1 Tax=Oryzibacter oryziterrae TaxID=2766474 RepID=UPI001F022A65|nr:molybdate ABC transporter substrate-binding protein [Oryzibacter oryziterrae]
MSKFATLLATVAFGLSLSAASAADQVKIFAGASIAPSLQKAADLYKASGKDVEFAITPGASGQLAKQIEAGAPADIFVSADVKWEKYTEEKGLVKPETAYDLAGNDLVLVAGKDADVAVDLSAKDSLPKVLGDERIAVGEAKSVPAGAYAEEALKKLGLYDAVSPHFAPAENVRVALQMVARGEAKLGIVYATDAKAEPGVKVIATFAADTHKPIVYPLVVTKDGSAAAADFATWLKTEKPQAILAEAGFAKTVK